MGQADVVVGTAPLFEERLQMNCEAVHRGLPLVDCAMYELEGRLTTIIPGQTPCLSCLSPEPPPNWKREFPVFGAVASTVGCLAAMEVIKLTTGLGEPLTSPYLNLDVRDMTFTTIAIARRPDCAVLRRTIARTVPQCRQELLMSKIVLCLLLAASSASANAADWPMWRTMPRPASSDQQLPDTLHLQWVRKLPPSRLPGPIRT